MERLNNKSDSLKSYGIANNSNLTIGLDSKAEMMSKQFISIVKHRPQKSSYIARNGIRGLHRRRSRKGRLTDRPTVLVLHKRQLKLKIDLKQNKLQMSSNSN
jgi:hypothetical protein